MAASSRHFFVASACSSDFQSRSFACTILPTLRSLPATAGADRSRSRFRRRGDSTTNRFDPPERGATLASTGLVERYRRARRDPRLAVLEGLHALKHAVRFGAEVEHIAVADLDRVRSLAAQVAADLDRYLETAPVTIVPEATFAELAPQAPPTGVIALSRRPSVSPEAVLSAPSPAPVILLDRPAHLGNIGAVVRVAAAAGAAGVLTLGSHDPWDPAAIRGGAGLQYALPVTRIDALPDSPRPLVAFDPGGEPLGERPLPERAILAFGSERHGLDPALRIAAERRVGIPMRPGVSSLNLATAVAVALYAGGGAVIRTFGGGDTRG